MLAALLSSGPALRLAKWGAIALAVLLVLLRVRDSGRQAERVNNLSKALEAAKARKNVEIAVDRLPARAVDDELHRDWSRD
ncbi:MAG: hypothetical protein LDL39_10505 [Magnetospirillum sp.]|nr:hypothetical protein [Magnetospirillum sp.]